jgi:hypothetical protein
MMLGGADQMAKRGGPQRFDPEQQGQIIREYLTRLPDGTWPGQPEIARRWDCAIPTIAAVLKRNGIPTRGRAESHAGKRCKPIKNLPPEGDQPPACKCDCGSPVVWNQRKNRWNVYVDGHYRRDAPYKNANWLRRRYVTEGATLAEIAAECGVNLGTIANFMRKLGIDRRDKSAARMGRKVGSLNAAWRGGTTPERQRLYKAGHWREFSQSIYRRDGFHCVRCGSPKMGDKGLHAHHVKAWSGHPELRFDAGNCVTLCDRCHRWVHSRANTARAFIA